MDDERLASHHAPVDGADLRLGPAEGVDLCRGDPGAGDDQVGDPVAADPGQLEPAVGAGRRGDRDQLVAGVSASAARSSRRATGSPALARGCPRRRCEPWRSSRPCPRSRRTRSGRPGPWRRRPDGPRGRGSALRSAALPRSSVTTCSSGRSGRRPARTSRPRYPGAEATSQGKQGLVASGRGFVVGLGQADREPAVGSAGRLGERVSLR